MGSPQEFSAYMSEGPVWIQMWVNFIGLVFLLGIPFAFKRVEPRWALLSMVLVFPTMMFLFGQFGYERILGLAHILFWTPLLVWLLLRRSEWQVKETWTGKWIVLLVATVTVSLAFDYVDVIRYLLGDRA